MIRADAKLEIRRVPLHAICITEYQQRSPDRVLHYVNLLQANPDQAPGLILLKKMPNSSDTFQVLDGHHRLVAHVIAGRSDVLGVIIDEENTDEPATDDQLDRAALRAFVPAAIGADAGQAGRRDLRANAKQREAVVNVLNAWNDTAIQAQYDRAYLKSKWPALALALHNFYETHKENN